MCDSRLDYGTKLREEQTGSVRQSTLNGRFDNGERPSSQR
jgi:hypothetical protein